MTTTSYREIAIALPAPTRKAASEGDSARWRTWGPSVVALLILASIKLGAIPFIPF